MAHISNIGENVKEYSNRSTVHGIGYICDKKLGLFDRCLWLIMVISCMSMALWLITSSYASWQDNLVITTLKTTTKPVSELKFPAVTIYADGKKSFSTTS